MSLACSTVDGYQTVPPWLVTAIARPAAVRDFAPSIPTRHDRIDAKHRLTVLPPPDACRDIDWLRDFDADGVVDLCDSDDDNDAVPDLIDPEPRNAFVKSPPRAGGHGPQLARQAAVRRAYGRWRDELEPGRRVDFFV